MAGAGIARIWRSMAQTASMGLATEPLCCQIASRSRRPTRRDHSVTDTTLIAASEPDAGFGRISLRTLVPIRWVAIAGQALTILTVHYGLGFALPLVPALAVVAGSGLLNIVLIVHRQAATRPGERDPSLYLAYDILHPPVLPYLPAGLQNPSPIPILPP